MPDEFQWLYDDDQTPVFSQLADQTGSITATSSSYRVYYSIDKGADAGIDARVSEKFSWFSEYEKSWLLVTLPESVIIKKIKIFSGLQGSTYISNAQIRVGDRLGVTITNLFCFSHLTTPTTYTRLFFLTLATEKTKTQAQNSSQKLKEKLNHREALSSF